MENQLQIIPAPALPANLPSSLTLTQQQLVAAQSGPKVSEASNSQLSLLWTKVCALLGIRVSPEKRVEFENDLFEFTGYIQEEYPNLYLNEIFTAYKLAVKRELGIEVLIPVLAPTYFGEVWKSYTNYRHNTLKPLVRKQAFLQAAQETTAAPSPEEHEKTLRELFAKAFETSKQGKRYYDAGNLLFDWLLSKDLIFFSQERIDGFFARASDELKKEAERGKKETSLIGEIAKYKKMFEDAENAASKSVEIRAKHIAFDVLLKEVFELGISTEDYLDNNF